MSQPYPAHLANATCKCGHGVNHPSVEARPVFGVWKWVKVLNGIATLPNRVEYRCRKCGTVLGSTREPEILREYL